MIREPSTYCKLAQKISFSRKVNALAELPEVKWTGKHFMKKNIMFVTPLFELFSIINYAKPVIAEEVKNAISFFEKRLEEVFMKGLK